MGFEILPVEDGDEAKYDIITITNPDRWTPHRFQSLHDEEIDPGHEHIQATAQVVQEETSPLYYFDPTDNARDTINTDHDGYPHTMRHTSQANLVENQMVPFGLVEPNMPMMETQAYATSTWHRVIHQDIDPMHLRPYLGWRPLTVVKKTLEVTTQMAKMIIRYPLRRHIKSRFPHMNVTRIDETVSSDPLFANCKSIYSGYSAAQIFYGTKS